jgi:mannosyltransferase
MLKPRFAETPSRYFPVFAVAILLLTFWVRVWDLGGASLWVDEMFTYMRAQGSLAYTLRTTLETDNHTPLYFLSTHLFPSTHELTLRYSAALAGVLVVAVSMFVARRFYRNPVVAFWVGLLLAVNPYAVLLSRMARPYAPLLLLSLVVSYAFLKIVTGKSNRALWGLFIISSALAYMTHYFALMLPLAQYATLAFVLQKNRGLLWRWMLAQVVVGLPLLVWMIALLTQATKAPGIGWIPKPTPGDIALTLQNMTVGYQGAVNWYMIPGLVVVIIGLVMGTYYAFKNWRSNVVNLYWFWLAFAPLVTMLALSRLLALYVDRYFIEILPAVLLLVLTGLMAFPQRLARGGLTGLLLVSSVLSIGFTLHRGDDEREAWRSAAAIVKAHYQTGDALLVQRSAVLNAFTYYYGFSDIDNLELLGISDPQAGIYALDEQMPADIHRVWAIYDAPHDAHRLGPMPSPDPFKLDVSPISAWLVPREQHVLAVYPLNGLTLLLVDVTEDFASQPLSQNDQAP